MPKADRSSEDKGKVKFRFVEFELEGLNSTIEESVKNIVNSMSRSPNVQTRALASKPTAPPALPSANGDGHAELAPETEAAIETETAVEEVIEEAARARPKMPRRYTTPNFLGDLDLDSGDPSFKTYAEQQAPKTDNRKYIVIAAWLKKYRDLETITTDHVYTCYQKMGWKSQKDVGQPFRYMKMRSQFENPSRNVRRQLLFPVNDNYSSRRH